MSQDEYGRDGFFKLPLEKGFPKMISGFSVSVLTREQHIEGFPPITLGTQTIPHPNIEGGFLIYTREDGAICGICLEDVLQFFIEPIEIP